MNDNAGVSLRNVIVLALADGKLAPEERTFIEELRKKLDINKEDFNELCRQVKEDRTSITVPKGEDEVRDMLQLLVQTAAIDGQMDPTEHKFLLGIVRHAGIPEMEFERMVASCIGPSREQLAILEKHTALIYAHFNEWDQAKRCEVLDEMAAEGMPATIPMLRMFESYRVPDGAEDALELKIMLAEYLGNTSDSRVVYYMYQQATIGEMEDETTSSELRQAALAAISKIVEVDFSDTKDGKRMIADWWKTPDGQEYVSLAL